MKQIDLETARTILRPPVMSDAESIYHGYAVDPEVTRYMIWPTHTDISHSHQFIKDSLAKWESGEEQTWMLALKETGDVIGCISIRMHSPKAEIGYVLQRSYWKKGIMSEVSHRVVSWAFKQRNISRVWATCNIDNIGSRKVLEKIGMYQEGILHNWSICPNLSAEARDCYVYSVIKG